MISAQSFSTPLSFQNPPCHHEDVSRIGENLKRGRDDHGESSVSLPPSSSIRSSSNIGDPPTKRQRTKEEKKMDRILANRRSARESRERRKLLQNNLESSVCLLTKEHADLTKENGILKNQMTLLLQLLNKSENQLCTLSAGEALQETRILQLLIKQVSMNESGGSIYRADNTDSIEFVAGALPQQLSRLIPSMVLTSGGAF